MRQDDEQVELKDNWGVITRLAATFLTSRLPILLIIASLLLGVAAVTYMDRREDPEVTVPAADVFVSAPGVAPEEVENLVTEPLESYLWEIEGVDKIFSASSRGQAVVSVRFHVGEDQSRSLVKLWDKLMSRRDRVPPIVEGWTMKPREIDDVPVMLFSFWAPDRNYTRTDLKRIAEETKDKLRAVDNTGRMRLVGGGGRQVTVELEPRKLAAFQVTPLQVQNAIRGMNEHRSSGSFTRNNRTIRFETGRYLRTAEEVRNIMVRSGREQDRPVYLRDVADVRYGPGEPDSYTRIGFGPSADAAETIAGEHLLTEADGEPSVRRGDTYTQATLAVAKRPGSNSVEVAEQLRHRVRDLESDVIPDDVAVTVTRNYGKTADHKVNELLNHLFTALATIILLLVVVLGFRESFVVAVAVPMTMAVTLFLAMMFGYTINRVTLFALVLSLGMLVDDPIVDVENIHRHLHLKEERPIQAVLSAVHEIRPPITIVTITSCFAFFPLFFITGMMGQYMGPTAFMVPVALIISLIISILVTPWVAYKLLRGNADEEVEKEDVTDSIRYPLYDAVFSFLTRTPLHYWGFLGVIFLAFLGSMWLPFSGRVPVKMLPFDNNDELQLVVDMPEGTPLEQTDAVVRDLEQTLASVREVADFESYVGTFSPVDFNGLMRQYYLRRGEHLADIRMNFHPKGEREHQSHEIALRIRRKVETVEQRHPGAEVKVIEVPPGPPVLSTVVGEVHGPPGGSYSRLIEHARTVRQACERTEGVVDVDDFVEAQQEKVVFEVDRDRARQHGVSQKRIARTLRTVLRGTEASILHSRSERSTRGIVVRVPREERSSVSDLTSVRVRTDEGTLVPLSELGTVRETTKSQTIYHKNMKPVMFVTANMAGRSPVPAVFDLQEHFDRQPLPDGYRVDFAAEGEWNLTRDVFRDLGIAFAAALILIYMLLVAQTNSLLMPLVLMVAIPLTVIGIMPGFWMLNTFFTSSVAGYTVPIYFTATGMMGMIALSGIVLWNSILLIDFAEILYEREENYTVREALIEAGATRMRPIFLTATTAMAGAWVITLDPIFSALAWSFIFGVFASTLFTLLVVPTIYYIANRETDA
jgi:multidrug efflux pump subunit AcrB